MSDIAVLGAGPAGIMTALKAREQGHEVTIFEASERVGGMAASFEVAGQRVDFGSHRLHPATDPEIMSLIKSLLVRIYKLANGMDEYVSRTNGSDSPCGP